MLETRRHLERRLLPWLLAGAFAASLTAVAVGDRLGGALDAGTATPIIVVLHHP